VIPKHNINFVNDIEKICVEKRLDYIDAIVYWCEEKGLDVEYAASLIKKDSVMKSKIQSEAEFLNIIKKTESLPA